MLRLADPRDEEAVPCLLGPTRGVARGSRKWQEAEKA